MNQVKDVSIGVIAGAVALAAFLLIAKWMSPPLWGLYAMVGAVALYGALLILEHGILAPQRRRAAEKLSEDRDNLREAAGLPPLERS